MRRNRPTISRTSGILITRTVLAQCTQARCERLQFTAEETDELVAFLETLLGIYGGDRPARQPVPAGCE
jgi:hypothetical protein